MKLTRREALLSALFGAGHIGLRSLATGLPASFLLNPRRALAQATSGCTATAAKAQFFIMATSAGGDPINANVPGTYEDTKITHSADATMAATALTLAGQKVMAAKPWSTLPQPVLDRTAFFHLMTNTPVHPKEPDVLQLQGASDKNEMLPSLLAKAMAPCLGTLQAQPITVGATSPSEGLTFEGQALPIIPPLSLKTTLTSPAGPLTKLQPLRDQTLNQLSELFRGTATPAEKAYLDALVLSQTQMRSIKQDLLNTLSNIKDNSVDSQIIAALTLIQMKVAPVVVLHIPFGGDNHTDGGLANEASQTVSGVAAIASLLSQLGTAGLQDQVSFVTLNVFGRTLGPSNTNGRNHNQNHQVSVAIGKPFRGGVVGGVAPVMNDYGATGIDSASGKSAPGGDVAPIDTLASFGKTLLAAVGVDSGTIGTKIKTGKVIAGAIV